MGGGDSKPEANGTRYAPLADAIAKLDDVDDPNEDWESSDDEAWPISSARYGPLGDAGSKVSRKGSSRLATEFTMGAGFHHLNEEGNLAMFKSPAGTIFPPPAKQKAGPCHYNEAAIALMKEHGLCWTGLRADSHTFLRKVLILTDAPHAIKVYIGNKNGLCVVGISLSRDGIVFTSGVLSEDHCPPLILQLDPERPIIDSIEMQSCTWLTEGRTGGTVEKKMSYLKISCGSEALIFGEPRSPGFDGNRSIYAPTERAEGKLCIAAIGYFNHRPVCLQVVDLGSDCEEVVDAMNTNVYYHNGVISGNITRSRQAEVEFLESITTDQNHVWEVLDGCMDAIENSRPCHGELLPNAVDLLEEALRGDIETIHSVLRMDRFLTHIIQEQKTIKTFESDRSNFYSKLIPLKQMWGILSNSIERIKRVHSYQPELNSFNVAFLEATDNFFWKAVFIFLTQATLLVLTVSHVWDARVLILRIPSLLKLVVAVCGTVVVGFMGAGFKDNFDHFCEIFPEYSRTTLHKLDVLSNVFGGYVVTLCTFFLLLMTENNLDVVLNATALLFVLELDEMTVDHNPIYLTSLYRAYFMKAIIKDLNESDKRYWDPSYLRKNRGEHYRIHKQSCSILFHAK
jgi:hypothetical protein